MTNEELAGLLDRVATAGQRPVPLIDVCTRSGLGPHCPIQIEAVLQVLHLFDAIQMSKDPRNGDSCVQPRSVVAGLFLKSLAAHLREAKSLVSNWERPGISEGPLHAHEVLSGPQFLYLIERERLRATGPAAEPVRKTTVVKAVIKGFDPKTGASKYLVQFDGRARHFQLIGGHRRVDDSDLQTALRRELSEELPDAQLRFPEEYDLRHLGTVRRRELSLTYGAYTEYELHYYQPIMRLRELRTAPTDRWISEMELLQGRTGDGARLNESAISDLDQALPGGLAGLRPSVEAPRKSWIVELWHRRTWEITALAVTLIGILLSLLSGC